MLFSTVAVPIYTSTEQEDFLFSTASPVFIVFVLFVYGLFDDGHCNMCEVISHCFCISLVTNVVEHLFMYLLAYLYAFFGEMSIYVFPPLFNWVVCFSGSELYELLVYFGN